MADIVPRPTAFDTPLANWMVDSHKESIFFVRDYPRRSESTMTQINELMADAHTLPEADKEERLTYGKTSTAFVVDEGNGRILLLTCAHSLDHLFTGTHPISAQQANHLYHFRVSCHHCEIDYQQQGEQAPRDRRYSKARVIQIDCARDLMLLEVMGVELHGFDTEICLGNHPPLRLAQDASMGASRCMMISWPPYHHCMISEGHGSDNLRLINEISVPNMVGYDMSVLEVNISSVKGSSGAPLLNGVGNVVGLLHGGFGTPFSYFVPQHYIREFLAPHMAV